MTASNAQETAELLYFFNGTAPGFPATPYIALYTADPGEAGTAVTSEATFTGYLRVPMAADNTKWTVSGNQVSNAIAIAFAACSGGSNTIAHWGIVSSSSGAGTLHFSGAFASSLVVSANVVPNIAIGALVVTKD